MLKSGKCSFGSSCRFDHDPENVKRVAKKIKDKKKNGGGDRRRGESAPSVIVDELDLVSANATRRE